MRRVSDNRPAPQSESRDRTAKSGDPESRVFYDASAALHALACSRRIRHRL